MKHKDKQTMPGTKQVFRYEDHDLIGCFGESPACPENAQPPESLLKPVILDGELVAPLPDVHAARERASESLKKMPAALRSLFSVDSPYRVDYSKDLLALQAKNRRETEEVHQ